MNELEAIIKSIEEGYYGNAWHGPAILEVVSQIPASQSGARLGNSHSISEILMHMAAWKIFVSARILDDQDYQVTDEINFPQGYNLAESLIELETSHKKLIKALQMFNSEKLHQLVPGLEYSFHKLFLGIVQHDLYHLGQIVMITKLF